MHDFPGQARRWVGVLDPFLGLEGLRHALRSYRRFAGYDGAARAGSIVASITTADVPSADVEVTHFEPVETIERAAAAGDSWERPAASPAEGVLPEADDSRPQLARALGRLRDSTSRRVPAPRRIFPGRDPVPAARTTGTFSGSIPRA